VIDLRSFTSARGLPARFSTNIGVLTIVVRRPSSLVVVSPALPADADRRGSSEEAMRNVHSDSEPGGTDNQLAGDHAQNVEGLPNRLLTAREVARFVGCPEETIRRAYWRGLLLAALRRQRKEVSPRRRPRLDRSRRTNEGLVNGKEHLWLFGKSAGTWAVARALDVTIRGTST
jgi:hypothetical protein